MRFPTSRIVRVVAAVSGLAVVALIAASAAFAWSGGLTSVSGKIGANGWYTSQVTVAYQFSAAGHIDNTSDEYLLGMTCTGTDGTSNT
jgi:hypothetical protein